MVVECLLKKVKNPGFNVAKYPIGLEERLKDFEDFLLHQPNEKPMVVGIVGLGGVGKTTLAKELFNRKSSYYPRSCFLSHIRENAAKSCFNGLQRKLLQSMGRFDKLIDEFHEDIEILIENPSFFSQSLLILDDADNVDQLYAFLPRNFKDILPSNCFVLITSRDKSVLLKSGLQDSSIYKLTGLNTQHSTELFCLHAFCQPRPLPGFGYLVDKILRVCNGLPLSLKVFGANFCGESNKSNWEGQLNRLQYILPAHIQQSLRVSYDSLDREEQQIFLDIACFLIGEKRDTAIRIWDRSGSLAFQNLQNRCLVEVDTENCLHMHDHIRGLGREIATDSGLFVPSVWHPTENMNIDNLLHQLSEKAQVRGIRMVPGAQIGNDNSKYYASLRSGMPWFKRRVPGLFRSRVMKVCNAQHKILYPGITMSNLRVLVTEDHLLERILRTARLPDLRWLRWYKCGHSSLPSWIPMENLRVLHVVGSALKILWQGQALAPLQLRELEIWAPLSKFPKSIGTLRHLEQIYVSLPEENNLKSLPEEFCQLLSLKRLELINAWKIKSLPDSIGDLSNLEHLNLLFSYSLERLPNSFENLNRLKYLDLRGSHFLTISSQPFRNITYIDFVDRSQKMIRVECEMGRTAETLKEVTMNRQLMPLQLPQSLQELHITKLPSIIENLTNLEVLELQNSLLEKLPGSLRDLGNLKELRLVECNVLKCLSDSLGLLTNLEIKSCGSLAEVGPLPITLIQLSLISCCNLKKIDGLCGLEKLQMLNISWWTEVEEPTDIETLVSLEELRASGCVKLKRIQGLGQLTKLRLLDVSGCSEIEELEGIEHLMSLEKLDASKCPKLQWDERVLKQLRQRLKEGMLYI